MCTYNRKKMKEIENRDVVHHSEEYKQVPGIWILLSFRWLYAISSSNSIFPIIKQTATATATAYIAKKTEI